MPTEQRAFAKLTKTLRITGRRDDGYHLLRAEMVTVDFADDLTFTDAEISSLTLVDEIAWERSDRQDPVLESPTVPADASNLVLRALALTARPAAVLLVKRIPAGGGLGGGSSDAAAALRHAGVFDSDIAVSLGADVPFCMAGGRAVVSGVGEIIEPLPFVPLDFVVVTPGFGVSTPSAYAAFDELGSGAGENDLERAACAVEPRLARVRELIASVAGGPVELAGSGSSYFVECVRGQADRLRSEIADAFRSEGVVASVVRCASTPPITVASSSA